MNQSDTTIGSSHRLGEIEFPDKPEGPIAAAIIAGGIGAAALGLLTTPAEASTSVHDWLDWNADVGPLSGKTIMAVIVWLVAWAILHVIYRNRPYETGRALTIATVLIALGVMGTFPTFFQAFAPD
jgi:acyl CoA:acetate/3-ketoacid CoA transferase alpha subunit